jgi:DNA-directed RNA polymerase subunit RPC12/RpoP
MEAVFACPECNSLRLFKAGLRYLSSGATVQRYLCRSCGFRFSNSEKTYKVNPTNKGSSQICALKVKNLDTQTIEKVCAGDGNLLNYAWLLKKKRGNSDNTINLRVSTLRYCKRKV